MTDRVWQTSVPTPTADAIALVAETTGWPLHEPTASPMVWTEAVMSGVNTAVRDPRFGIDLLSIRLVEAAVTADSGPSGEGPATVTTTVVQVVDLGDLAGLRMDVAVLGPTGASLCRATATVAGRGSGLAEATRPMPGEPTPSTRTDHAPGRPPASVAVDAAVDPVVRFTRWSGDDTPFHTDAEAARLAGLPGPIAPGMWVLGALAGAAAAATGGPIVAVGARFVRPTVIGDRLQLTVHWPDGDPAEPHDRRLALAASGPSGPVVRRAWALPA